MTPVQMDPTDFKYELFFELSPDLLCIAGFDGYFKKINPAVSKTLGYSMEELYSRPINDFVHPDDKEMTNKVRTELIRSKPLFHFENRYQTKNGETLWLSWTSLPVERDNVIFAIAKNVTHKKHLEVERNALLANLSRANKELLKLNDAASHGLQSSVNNLLALFELMDVSRISDQETVQLVDVLQYAGEKIKHALNNYTPEPAEDNFPDTEVEETDFQECLNEAMESIATLVHTSGAKINADFSQVPRIMFNKAYLKSIFLNLVTNSIRYASPGRPAVISIHTKKDKGVDTLVIADNGAGLDTRKVKSDYFSIDPRTRKSDSKGIGLYLVQTYVSAFGGDIKVESKLNEGTTFLISFKPR